MNTIAQLQQSITRHEGYLKTDPRNPHLWLMLGDLYHRSGNFAQAIDAFERCGEYAADERTVVHGRVASVLISQHRFDEAESRLRAIISSGENSPELLHNLGLALYYQEKWQEAQRYFEQAIDAAQASASALDYLARALHHQGDIDKAIEACERRIGVDNDPQDEGRGYLALLHLDNGNTAEADTLAQAVLARSPHNRDAAIVAGVSAVERQEIDNAARWFGRVAERQPNSGRALLGLGLVHLYLQEHAQAVDALERAARLMPNNAGTVVTLGWARLAMRDIAGSEQTFRRAIEVDRNFAESHGGLASALAMQGKVDSARESIHIAKRLDPRSFGAAFAQGVILKIRGQNERATRFIATLLEQSPTEGSRRLIDYIRDFLRTRTPPSG
ncbi:MAG TPA: tetratricopeptide repeat protein [Burkholderiales bacterium]|nr:tetratricopeptide repeat protein [Burkholderiales bacterium]